MDIKLRHTTSQESFDDKWGRTRQVHVIGSDNESPEQCRRSGSLRRVSGATWAHGGPCWAVFTERKEELSDEEANDNKINRY